MTRSTPSNFYPEIGQIYVINFPCVLPPISCIIRHKNTDTVVTLKIALYYLNDRSSSTSTYIVAVVSLFIHVVLKYRTGLKMQWPTV